jgi:hypothetical protein
MKQAGEIIALVQKLENAGQNLGLSAKIMSFD